MHFETEGLPPDICEVFFSDKFFYAASAAKRGNGRSRCVGSGATRVEAIEDMRRLAKVPRQRATPALRWPAINGTVILDEHHQRTLAEELHRLRTDRGLSQMQVARQALGFTKSHAFVSRLERGALSRIEGIRLIKLLEFFGVSF